MNTAETAPTCTEVPRQSGETTSMLNQIEDVLQGVESNIEALKYEIASVTVESDKGGDTKENTMASCSTSLGVRAQSALVRLEGINEDLCAMKDSLSI